MKVTLSGESNKGCPDSLCPFSMKRQPGAEKLHREQITLPGQEYDVLQSTQEAWQNGYGYLEFDSGSCYVSTENTSSMKIMSLRIETNDAANFFL